MNQTVTKSFISSASKLLEENGDIFPSLSRYDEYESLSTAYNNMTTEQQDIIKGSHQALVDSIGRFDNLKNDADYIAAKDVYDKIQNIGNVTTNSKPAIDAA
jgi:hypothetical protein